MSTHFLRRIKLLILKILIFLLLFFRKAQTVAFVQYILRSIKKFCSHILTEDLLVLFGFSGKADMTHDRAATLRQPEGLADRHPESLMYGRAAQDLRGQHVSLSADTGNDQIYGVCRVFIHFSLFPPRIVEVS